MNADSTHKFFWSSAIVCGRLLFTEGVYKMRINYLCVATLHDSKSTDRDSVG
jgi:hypothetical protein